MRSANVMIRFSLWLAVGLLFVAGLPNCYAERPNVVLIMADDLGYETVGCYGGESYKTPNMDRIAKEGVKFDRAYAMPLCTNTRIQLMTGKYNNRNWKAFGILDPKEKTFGHLMQDAGYKTCIAGKWQLTSYDPPDYPGAELRRNTGMHPKDAGFDEYCLWHVGHTETKGSRYADPVIEKNGQVMEGTDGKYGPDLWTDFLGDFMEKNREEPFFVYYSMALPHNPMVPTPDSPEWTDVARRHSDETPFAADMIEYTDKMLGKIVAKLDEIGVRENTLLLFYSDNGTNWRVRSRFRGQMVRGAKSKGTELGIRVPCLVEWPGKTQAGKVSQALIDSADFLPTMLDAAGATIPDGIDGVSFLPLLDEDVRSKENRSVGDGSNHDRKWVYIHQDPRPGWDKDRFSLIRLALNERYKLYEDGRLYDLKNDFYEEFPLYTAQDTSEQREGRAELQKVLDSMKPYQAFDPAEVPRPNLNAGLMRHQFQDQGGLVVVEAEQIPTPRDGSWVIENGIPDYTGTGFVRAVREQTVESAEPENGVSQVYLSIDAADTWRCAIRCRTDHVDSNENKLWIRAGDGPWMIAEIKDARPGEWTWIKAATVVGSSTPAVLEFDFGERGNKVWVAPYSQNLKLDRIVFYQHDTHRKALDLKTPCSSFHPWARP